MAKQRGSISALYMSDQSQVSTIVSGASLSRIGTTLWWMVASSTNFYWDKAKTIVVYDGITLVVPLEIDYSSGAVRLSAVPGGAVTADFYKFTVVQVGGFRNFSIDENMEMVECGCFEDDYEVYEPGAYSANGSGDGFWSSVDSSHDFNGLTIQSRILGSAGDSISAECLVAGNNTPLTVSLATQKITINSATSAGGVATSKLREIRDALEANASIAGLVRCKYTTGHDGSEIMYAIAEAHLAGGAFTDIFSSGSYDEFTTSKGSDNDLTFRAVEVGDHSGNPITVTCVVSGNDTVLDVTVADTDITIVSGTGPTGTATSAAQQIREKINSDADAKLLIVALDAPGSSATGIFGALSKVTLVGGESISTFLRWGEDIIGVFYWDSGANLYRTTGLIQFETKSLKTGVKGLVGKTLSWKSQGMMYDRSG